MLTYTLNKDSKISLYEQLYRCIRDDILSGRLKIGDKLPSKRILADHLKISSITVKSAYEQLIAEGYLYAVEKKGYYVDKVDIPPHGIERRQTAVIHEARDNRLDLASNSISSEDFPFSSWAKTMRRVLLEYESELLVSAPFNGAGILRCAIADYLWQFRGMQVNPERVIIGAGTEFLYSLLIQLMGREHCYAVEDPGYAKIARIYTCHGVRTVSIPLDERGLSVTELCASDAEIVHLSPSHHYPTGIVMPIGRRQELLRWAGEADERYILEDDYDSEFRFIGKPIPTLFSIDKNERVIYLNTFSKTIAPSIRISYMILPEQLMERYRRKLSFCSCTVSSFEQYTLAEFMRNGNYEQHINRMRNRYRKKRDAVIKLIEHGRLAGKGRIAEQDAGLHFLLKLDTNLSDAVLKSRAAERGIRLSMLSDYYYDSARAEVHTLVVNYSGTALNALEWGFNILSELI